MTFAHQSPSSSQTLLIESQLSLSEFISSAKEISKSTLRQILLEFPQEEQAIKLASFEILQQFYQITELDVAAYQKLAFQCHDIITKQILIEEKFTKENFSDNF